MKLLIVDDQKSVVDGLLKGVNWSEIGITAAYGATSATEARVLMSEIAIDVLLCDIEMPIEDGLSLLKWMRESGMQARCILLTAHAEFRYAKKSLELGAFDYVVQPAPYSEIRASVKRAVEDIKNEISEQFRMKYVEVSEWQRQSDAAATLSRYLRDKGDISEIIALSKEGRLPGEETDAFLVLLRIIRWTSYDNWTPELLTVMISNIASEVFSPYGQTIMTFPVSAESFAFLLWGEEYRLAPESVAHQLSFFYNVCQKQLKCMVALYQTGPVSISGLQEAWCELQKSGNGRSEKDSGFFVGSAARGSYEFLVPEMSHWLELFGAKEFTCFESEISAYLANYGDKGGKALLRNIYQDFMQVLHLHTGNGYEFWRSVLVDSDSYDIYRHGMESSQALLAVIHMALRCLESRRPADEGDVISELTQYIEEHLDSDINRAELATLVHMHPDHLNRVFKKKTGSTIKDYIIHRKMDEASKMLRATSLPVSIIAAKVGYTNFSHFSSAYRKVIGHSPLETRQKERHNEG